MKQKPIFNIFSKRIPKEKKHEEIKITADYREKNSLIISKLLEAGIEVELKELKVADYLVKGVAIERKTVSDFISSMLSGRLLKQLGEIQQYDNRLLMIEGIDEQELYSMRFPSEAIEEITKPYQEGKRVRENRRLSSEEGIHPNSIRGFLLSILLRHKVPIIFTKNSEDSAKFIELIAKKKKVESPLNVKKRSLNKKERMQFILEGFPGIGPKTARKLLEEFKTIKNIVNAPIGELTEIIGKKAEIFKLIDEDY